jgi:hypothetical protein
MPEMKPRIFIASSTEGKPVAEAIRTVLRRDAECMVWSDGAFGLSRSNVANLMKEVETSQFGIFVFSADDTLATRGSLLSAPRDNVVYELGLFSGRLGPERCFFVTPEGADIHLPTDLLGLTAGEYETGRRDSNMQAAVGPFCTEVRNKIREMTIGVKFLHPAPDAHLDIGWQTFTCECTARPGNDVFLFTQKGDLWWQRRERLERTTDNVYEVKTHFDVPEPVTVHIIKGNDIGSLWVENYRRMVDQLDKYPPMIKGDLPRAFVSLDSITVNLVPKTP